MDAYEDSLISIAEIIQDYNDWLDEDGLTEYDIAFLMHEGVVIDCSKNNDALWIAPSPIGSLGVFANANMPEGTQWVACEGNIKYICGRFINHSPAPNCEFRYAGNKVVCVLIKPVARNEELFVNYRKNAEIHQLAFTRYKQNKSSLKKTEAGVISDKVMISVVKNILPVEEQENAFNELEAQLIQMPQVECPLEHRFTPGLYARELHIPKGTLITGLLHLTDHIFVISKGDLSTWYPGGEVTRVQAPFTGITKAGTRRMGYAHEDTIFTTFHATDETDPDQVIEQICDTRPNPLLSELDYSKAAWKTNRLILEETNI